MSLIQDALKRQQEEMNKKAAGVASPPAVPPVPTVPAIGKLETPGAPPPTVPASKIPLRMMGQPPSPPAEGAPVAAPPVPPPLPAAEPHKDHVEKEVFHDKAEEPASRNEPESEKRSPQGMIVALILLILVLIGFGGYMILPTLKKMLGFSSPEIPRFTAVKIPAPVMPEPPAVPVPPEPVLEVVTPPETLIPTGAVPVAAVPPATDTSTVAVAATPPAPAPLPALYVPPAPVAKLAPRVPVEWPPVKLTGMVKLGGTAAALIDGRVVEIGQTIDDVTLVSVTRDGALLKYKDEERTLKVGETAR